MSLAEAHNKKLNIFYDYIINLFVETGRTMSYTYSTFNFPFTCSLKHWTKLFFVVLLLYTKSLMTRGM